MSTQRTINAALLAGELSFSTARSSGPGGQNVNKVNSKVTLKLDVVQSQILTNEEKELIQKKLATKLTTEGILLISSQDKRSQLQNKEDAILKFEKLMVKAFTKRKARKTTKPSKQAIQNRITKKKQLSEKKKWRQKM